MEKTMKKGIRIAVDIQSLYTSRTGIKTYTERIIAEMHKLGSAHTITALQGPRILPTDKRMNRIVNQAIRFLWWQVILPIRMIIGHYDVLFSPVPLIPGWLPTAHVITVHDASIQQRPEDYDKLWLMMFNHIMLPQIKRAERIITDSQFSSQEIIRELGLQPDQVRVTPLAGPKSVSFLRWPEVAVQETLAKFGLRPWSYIIQIGVFEKRKNQVGLIEGYVFWRNAGHGNGFKLVLAGPLPNQTDIDSTAEVKEAIERNHLQKEVILPGYLTETEKNILLGHAATIAVPSLLEGFGFPILEGFSVGVPVIASDATSLPEVGGDAVLYFNPKKPEEIAQRMIELEQNPSLRMSLTEKGYQRLRQYSWEQTAQTTLGILEEAVNVRRKKSR